MKFISTKGGEYKVDIRPSRWPRRSKEDCKSKLQWGVSSIISETYPNDIILEEFFVSGDFLYIDFLLPRRSLAVEVHGRQHFEYSPFFHGSKTNFLKSQDRDKRKKKWCELNQIRLVVIKYDDKEDMIRLKLKNDKD
jgi:hypothetical protein